LAERIAVMHRGNKVNGSVLENLLKKNPGAPDRSSAEKDGERLASTGKGAGSFPEGLLDRNFSEAKEIFEKYYLEFQLSRNNGIISRTAEAIGIYPSNLHAKLRKYHITVSNAKEER
jgi:two-component system nitrogen regulation response regulator NtrX